MNSGDSYSITVQIEGAIEAMNAMASQVAAADARIKAAVADVKFEYSVL